MVRRAAHRTLDAVTAVLSAIGTTEFIIGACVLFVALFWWRTKQWWLAIVPPQAIAVQAIVFMTAALVVGRERPDVEKLDESPPTSSYPSGHTGASTAFYVVLAMLAQRIGNRALRIVVTVVCLLVPVAVGTARLYRGMHSLSDVLMGALNGLVCAFLAWNYLRRDTSSAASAHRRRSQPRALTPRGARRPSERSSSDAKRADDVGVPRRHASAGSR